MFAPYLIGLTALLGPLHAAHGQMTLSSLMRPPLGRQFVPVPNAYTPESDITGYLQQAIAHDGDHNGQDNPAEIVLPAGTFIVSATLTFPGSKPLRIVGAGKDETRLIWANDLGQGVYAIDASPTATFPLVLEHMTLQGPNQSAPNGGSNMGYAPSKMYGVHATDRADIEDCKIGGFYAGVVMDGNHHIVTNCTLGNNYYALYWIKSSDGTYADDYVGLCDLTGNRFASVACDTVASIGAMFERDHTGFEPYSFYREAGAVSDGTATWLGGCTFTVCQFEGVGNADFYDATGASAISGCTFRDCGGYGTKYGFAIPAANSAAGTAPPVGPSMTINNFWSNKIYNAGPTPGDMSAAQIANNTWEITGVASAYADGQLAAPIGTKSVYNNVIHDGADTLVLAAAQSTLTAGQPLELASGLYGQVFTVQPAKGVAPVAGVALQNAAAGSCAVVGAKGPFLVIGKDATSAFSLNQAVNVLSNGNLADSGGVQVGIAVSSASNGVIAWVNSVLSP